MTARSVAVSPLPTRLPASRCSWPVWAGLGWTWVAAFPHQLSVRSRHRPTVTSGKTSHIRSRAVRMGCHLVRPPRGHAVARTEAGTQQASAVRLHGQCRLPAVPLSPECSYFLRNVLRWPSRAPGLGRGEGSRDFPRRRRVPGSVTGALVSRHMRPARLRPTGRSGILGEPRRVPHAHAPPHILDGPFQTADLMASRLQGCQPPQDCDPDAGHGHETAPCPGPEPSLCPCGPHHLTVPPALLFAQLTRRLGLGGRRNYKSRRLGARPLTTASGTEVTLLCRPSHCGTEGATDSVSHSMRWPSFPSPPPPPGAPSTGSPIRPVW